ncbi:hypothetical protein B0A52_07552 [Exophiala mesophila]|uniref:BolA-like protein n=1 Tax=Exophiala mesophila TaxID=212818 RepID=A0A438MYS7_EXOME|nr:hypothetical protein B0A52_07552 [Exophiala mesophila]
MASTVANASATESQTPLADIIRKKITEALSPVELNIINNSHKHAHHSAMRGVTSKETHFELDIVSPSFAGKTQLSRHRMVNNLLKDEMAPGLVHALQLHTRTPEEDAKRQASSA